MLGKALVTMRTVVVTKTLVPGKLYITVILRQSLSFVLG